jgi:hypothetical protein
VSCESCVDCTNCFNCSGLRNQTNCRFNKKIDYCKKSNKLDNDIVLINKEDEKIEQNNEYIKIRQKEIKIYLDETEMECVVCMKNRKNILFIPCGHLCICEVCMLGFDINDVCPMCRREIVNFVKY